MGRRLPCPRGSPWSRGWPASISRCSAITPSSSPWACAACAWCASAGPWSTARPASRRSAGGAASRPRARCACKRAWSSRPRPTRSRTRAARSSSSCSRRTPWIVPFAIKAASARCRTSRSRTAPRPAASRTSSRCTSRSGCPWATSSSLTGSGASCAGVASASRMRSRATRCWLSTAGAARPTSSPRPSRALIRTGRATRPTSARSARSPRWTFASRPDHGSCIRPRRCAICARWAATWSSTCAATPSWTVGSRCSGSCRGRTKPSTSSGCATRAGSPRTTSRSMASAWSGPLCASKASSGPRARGPRPCAQPPRPCRAASASW